jgi:enterochelin esterase-like enzyme
VSLRRLRTPIAIVVMSLALAAVGLVGAYHYWESYYQHRGFATVAYLPHARRGTLRTVQFYSRALHRRTDYLVYLPPGYGKGRARYPVDYLLHGSPGRPQVFLGIAGMPVRMDNLISQHRMRPMILVLPDGRISGSTYSDSEWANTPSGDYANYVVNVVRDVDQRFATLAHRQDRVIAGFSMGAYGATNIALHHLGLFAGLQSWSGYYVQTRTGVFADAGRTTLDSNSPLDYVRGLRRTLATDPLRAFIFVGRDDDDSPQTQPMAQALAVAGGDVTYALYDGGHDWQLWYAHLDQMLMLASRDTSTPPRPAGGAARSLTPGVVPIPNGVGRHHRRASARHPRRKQHSRRRPDVQRVRRERRRPGALRLPGATSPI